MRVISRRALREFWIVHRDAEDLLQAWYSEAKHAEWTSFADVRRNRPSADRVGRFTVFNIGGNKYRLIVSIHYNRGMAFVRQALIHAEYDRGHWKHD